MNAYQIIEMAWDAIGRKSDLGTPNADDRLAMTAGQVAVWVQAMNRALDAVAFWKDPGQKIPFFTHVLEGEVLCKNTLVTETLSVDASATQITLSAQGYGGYVVDTGTETKLLQGTGPVYDVVEGFTSFPELGDEVDLLKNWLTSTELGDPSDLYEILQIYDVGNEKELGRGAHGDRYISKTLSTGDPTKWYMFGEKIYLDQLLEEVLYFRLEYARMPTRVDAAALVLGASDVDLPQPFHYALVLWCTEWGFRRYGESNEKYSTKRDFIDYMRSVQTQRELSFGRSKSQLSYRRK